MGKGDQEAVYIPIDTSFGGSRSQAPLHGSVVAFMKEAFRDDFLQYEGNVEYFL